MICSSLQAKNEDETKTDGPEQGYWRSGGGGVAFLLDFLVSFQ
jgi:hypothetical protein